MQPGARHDGIRRWAITFYTSEERSLNSRATFYSDAIEMKDAMDHVRSNYPVCVAPVIHHISPDTWLHR